MNYQTYLPHPDLAPLVKFYWTLEVPYDPAHERQKIIPDGCVEMTFNLADPIRRYTSDTDYVLHPRAMVMGQRTKPYHILPTGHVDSFAICFYPYGFANFLSAPLKSLTDKEVPIKDLFGNVEAQQLENDMIGARDTAHRIEIIEAFLLKKLKERSTADTLVQSTIDALLRSGGNSQIGDIIKSDPSKRRQLERKFAKQIGISPKQLGKVIRLQAALELMLHNKAESLTHVAYESGYYDQAHFIKDFKEFTDTNPREFLEGGEMTLATLFYQ